VKKLRVVICGVGPIGAKIAGVVIERNSLEITGAIDTAPDKAGRDLGEFTGAGKKTGVTIEQSAGKVLSGKRVDVVGLTPTSSLA